MPRPLWVVATYEPDSKRVVYLVIPDPDSSSMYPAQWGWVAPSDAAQRDGQQDYARFTDEAEAVAWVLRVKDWFEEQEAKYPGSWLWRDRAVWVWEIG